MDEYTIVMPDIKKHKHLEGKKLTVVLSKHLGDNDPVIFKNTINPTFKDIDINFTSSVKPDDFFLLPKSCLEFSLEDVTKLRKQMMASMKPIPIEPEYDSEGISND